jgi:hemin uptake protein HemP
MDRLQQLPRREDHDATPRVDVRMLLQGCREVILVHGAEHYRLKVTSAGKLILTK